VKAWAKHHQYDTYDLWKWNCGHFAVNAINSGGGKLARYRPCVTPTGVYHNLNNMALCDWSGTGDRLREKAFQFSLWFEGLTDLEWDTVENDTWVLQVVYPWRKP
jgi:hypothetical protein